MYDRELVYEILRRILWSAETVKQRCQSIRSVDDFLVSEEGLKTLDSICMQLIAIGESAKNLDKVTEGTLLDRYPQIEWQRVKGMRDVLSHHYFDLDAEVVYAICTTHIDELIRTIQLMLADIE